MKKFNKVLALGMAGSMALSMAACGGSSSSASTGTDGSSTSTAAPTAAPSKDVVTLKWVAVGSGMPSNYDAWLAQINPYLEDKIGVNIDMEVISWGDWDTRRNVIVNTSGEYDILFTNVNTYNNDVNTGAFLDITDMVKEAAPELYASVPEDYWKACEVGGRVYGVPTYKDSSQSEYLVWDKAKENRTEEKAIFIDECWQLIGASSNRLAAEFVLEIFKTPQAAYEANFSITVGQWLSVPFILLGIVMMLRAKTPRV